MLLDSHPEIEIQTQPERTVQSGSSPDKFPKYFLHCTLAGDFKTLER
jgi:hypothetical protein